MAPSGEKAAKSLEPAKVVMGKTSGVGTGVRTRQAASDTAARMEAATSQVHQPPWLRRCRESGGLCATRGAAVRAAGSPGVRGAMNR